MWRRRGSVVGVSDDHNDRFFFELGRLFGSIVDRLDRIESKVGDLMANIDQLRAAQADGTAALGELGQLISAEAAQVAQILNDLVAAVGNQVTDADVAEAVAAAERIRAAGEAVSNIAPDAPQEPPVDPPVE